MVDTSSPVPNPQKIAENDADFLIRLLLMTTIEELVTCAEIEPDLSELRADMIRGFVAEMLEKRCPNVFGINVMKKFFAEAETAEQRAERRPGREVKFLADLQVAHERSNR